MQSTFLTLPGIYRIIKYLFCFQKNFQNDTPGGLERRVLSIILGKTDLNRCGQIFIHIVTIAMVSEFSETIFSPVDRIWYH